MMTNFKTRSRAHWRKGPVYINHTKPTAHLCGYVQIPDAGFADALKSIFTCSASVCCAWDVERANSLGDCACLDPCLAASSAERPRVEIVRACHTAEDRAPTTPVPLRHSTPLGRLTLFQQPWTGKPSSPCSEEGKHTAQTLQDDPPRRQDRATRATNTAASDQDVAHPPQSVSFLFYFF